jgi:hypothetical protein
MPAVVPEGLPWQVTLSDTLASVMELAAAGGAGLAYRAGVNRWAPAGSSSSSSSSSSGGIARLAAAKAGGAPGLRRLGLLLLPAAAALLPLQLDAKRLQEAGGLLSRVAVTNDVILRHEAQGAAAAIATAGAEQCASSGGGWQSASAHIRQLAQAATAATAGA